MATELSDPASGAANELEYALAVEGVSAELFPTRFQVTEAFNTLYELQVDLAAADPELVLGQLLGKGATLTSTTPLGTRHWHGLVRRAELLGRARSTVRFRVCLVPRLWFLTHRQDSRIFQATSTPDILAEVLAAVGIQGAGLDQRLRRTYPPRDYCVQYRESDFAFFARLCEEEGITWFFSHTDGNHALVLLDDPAAHDPLPDDPEVLFRPPSFATTAGQVASEIVYAHAIAPNQATLRDYTFKSPTTDLETVSGPLSSAGDGDDQTYEDVALELYEYPGDYVEADLGATLVGVRLEAARATHRQLQARSNVRRLGAGLYFDLKEHSRPALNRRYLLIRVEHEGEQPLPDDERASPAPTYRNRTVATPDDLPFRPPRVTPRPFIPGIQTAIVTGPAGEEIHVDEYGRVKVHFHWDRLHPFDDSSSCWVRVSHAWAGTSFGQVFLPRIGQEVIVQFLEGDPDRPVVVGRLYNGDNALPYTLPDNKMKSTIKSNSTPGGGGFNEIRLDDTAGNEELFINGQYNATLNTNNNKTETVGVDASYSIGSNSSISVGSNEDTSVGADRSVSVGANQTHTVGSNRSISVGADETHDVGANRTVSVGADETHSVGANRSLSVGANQTSSVGANEDHSVGASRTHAVAANESISVGALQDVSVGAAQMVNVGAAQLIDVGAGQMINVGAVQSVNVGGAQSISVGAGRSVSVGAGMSTTVGAAWAISVGGGRSANVTGDDSVKASSNIQLDGGSSVVVKSGGATVTIKSGGEITLDGSDITLKASGGVTVQASGSVTVKGSKIGLN